MKSISLFISSVFCGLLLFSGAISAQSSGSISINETINATNTEKVQVSLQINLEQAQNQEISLPLRAQASQASINDGSISSEIKNNQLVFNPGGQSELNISYTATELYRTYYKSVGQMLVYKQKYPLNVSSQTLRVDFANETIASVAGPKPAEIGYEAGNQFYRFEQKDGEITQPIAFTIGSVAGVEVEIGGQLKNDSWWWKTKTVVLPADSSIQKVNLQSLDPNPKKVTLDPDGNIVASYSLGPKQSLDYSAKTTLNLNLTTASTTNSTFITDIPGEVVKDYQNFGKVWKSDYFDSLNLDQSKLTNKSTVDSIKKVVEAIIAKGKPALTDQNIDYTTEERVKSSSKPAQTSIAYADQSVSALRKLKIPARVVAGVLSTSDGKYEPHAWVEVFLADDGWFAFDPGMISQGKLPFGILSLSHLGQTVWGVEEISPEYNGNIEQIKYSSTSEPKSDFNKAVDLQKFMIVPGFSILKVSASMPAGSIYDSLIVNIDGQSTELGSLAPFQNFTTYRPVFGAKSWASSEAKFGVGIADQFDQLLAKKKVEISYYTMPIFLLIVGLLYFAYHRLGLFDDAEYSSRYKGKSKKKSSKNKDEAIEDQNLLTVSHEHQTAEEAKPKQTKKRRINIQ